MLPRVLPLFLILSSGCIFAPPPPPLPTVPGPEAAGLVEGVSGWLVLPARLPSGGLSAIRARRLFREVLARQGGEPRG